MNTQQSLFYVLPRVNAERFTMIEAAKQASKNGDTVQPKPYVVISIGDPDQNMANLREDAWRQSIHRVEVTDIDHKVEKNITLFNSEDAQRVLDFHEKWRNKTAFFLIHCEAGISRSRAVATALSLIEGNEQSSKKHIENGDPNALIIWEILHKYEKNTGIKVEWPKKWENSYVSTCEHNNEDLHYPGQISIDKIGTTTPVCKCCQSPGRIECVDIFSQWKEKYQPKNSQTKSR